MVLKMYVDVLFHAAFSVFQSSADGYQFSEEIRTRLDELLAKDKRGKQYVDIEVGMTIHCCFRFMVF